MGYAKRKRPFVLLLCAALLFSQPVHAVYAEEIQADNGGLCEHHPQHTVECGYKDAVPGCPCGHKHTADCYTDTLKCGYDEEGVQEGVQTASGSDAGHDHTQECYVRDCPHERGEHDAGCGYIEAVKGRPCGYVCEACKINNSGQKETDGGNTLPAPRGTEQKTVRRTDKFVTRITDFDTLDSEVQNRLVPAGTEWEALALPVTLRTEGYILADDTDPQPEPLTVKGIIWEIDPDHELNDGNGTYSSDIGSYCLTPVLPQGYELDHGVTLPEIYVRIDGQMKLDGGQDSGRITPYFNLDGALWSGYGRKMLLKATDESTLLSIPGSVPYGEYEIWEKIGTSDPVPTGVFVTVPGDQYATVDHYTVTFYDGVTPYTTDGLEPQIVLKGKKAEKPSEPVKDSYTFNKWVTANGGSSEFPFDSPIQQQTNVYAAWTSQPLYDPDDVAAFQALLEQYPSAFARRLDRYSPDTWGSGVQPVVTWSADRPKQIIGLDFSFGLAEKLTGCLDVSGLDNLTQLNCSRNSLNGLTLPGSLEELYCEENSLTALDVSGLNLRVLLCGANPLTSLRLPGGNELEVLTGEGGTVSLDEIIYSLNHKIRIKLRAKPDSGNGYFLKEWLDQNGAVKGTDEAVEILLSGIESVTAVFAKEGQYQVTVNGSYASPDTGEGSYTAGETVTVRAGTRSGYRFVGWTSGDGVGFSDASNETATFPMPDRDITVTAGWKAIVSESSGGGGSSDGSGASHTVTTYSGSVTNVTATADGGNVTTTQTTTTDSSGKKTTVSYEVYKDAAGNVTGSTTTVTTDRVTTATDQGKTTVTVKPEASAVNNAAGAAGATSQKPLELLVTVPQTVINEIQKPEVNTVTVNIVIPKATADNQAVGVAGTVIGKDVVQAARDSGKKLEVTLRNESGTVKAVWSLDGQAMKNVAGETTELSLGVHTAPVQSADPIAVTVKEPVAARGAENGLVLKLSSAGTLLTPAKLTVPATGQTGFVPGTTVTLYRYGEATKALTAAWGVYTVDENGNVTVDIPTGTRTGANEIYVLLAGPVQGAKGTYAIQKGDTLNKISRQYGCSAQDLLVLNPGLDIYNLQVGQRLNIPGKVQ